MKGRHRIQVGEVICYKNGKNEQMESGLITETVDSPDGTCFWFRVDGCHELVTEKMVVSAFTPGPWELTDNDTLQCRRTLDEEERVYELLQVDDFTQVGKTFRISRNKVFLAKYSSKELLGYLKMYGYESLEDFEDQHEGEIDWGIVAEMIFETELFQCGEEWADSFTDAGKKVEEITGLTLREYYSDTTQNGH